MGNREKVIGDYTRLLEISTQREAMCGKCILLFPITYSLFPKESSLFPNVVLLSPEFRINDLVGAGI